MESLDGWHTLRSVVDCVGVHYITVHRDIKRGKLVAKKRGTRWFVHEDDLCDYASTFDPSLWPGKPVSPVTKQAARLANEYRALGLKWREVADRLNEDGVPSANGHVGHWNADNVGNLCKRVERTASE